MDNFDSDDDIKRLLKAAYEPVAPPPEVRTGVLECLTLEAGRAVLRVSRPPWERPPADGAGIGSRNRGAHRLWGLVITESGAGAPAVIYRSSPHPVF